jgi:soluble lytic murein transglycosylase-like protein
LQSKRIMIEKLYTSGLIKNLDPRGTVPSPLSESFSPFQNILDQEINGATPLEKFVLDFLIKTIESLLVKNDQSGQWPSLSSIPLLKESSLQSPPVINNPVSKPVPQVSAGKPDRQEIDDIIQGAAEEYGVDPALIKAVISVESNGNPRAVSIDGAKGLMQLMPKTAAELGVTNPFDPAQNIMAGTRYLSRLLDRYEGNQKLALAAYNWGMGNVEKNLAAMPRETRNYIVRVEKHYQSYLNFSSTA